MTTPRNRMPSPDLPAHPFRVLMADDDPDDVALLADALAECVFASEFQSVPDGHALIQYLHRRGPYTEFIGSPDPDLILLDLNMPKQNGTGVLAEIKNTPYLRDIPVVILTTSDAARDQARTAGLGADGYLTKPSRYDALVEMAAALPDFRADQRPHSGE